MGSNKTPSSSNSSYDYYGTIVIGLGEGPIDALVSIIEDGKEIWRGPLLRDGASGFAIIAIPDRGQLRLYWGTSDQSVEEQLTPYETHPPYQDRAYIIAEDFLLGRERTNSPNWEFIVRRAPRQALVTGSPAALDANAQANIVAFAAELVTSPSGLALPLERFYAPSWQAVADAIDTPELRRLLACSPLLTSREKVRDLFERFGQIAQIWARRRASDGLIELGRWAPPADLSALPLLTADDLTDDLEFDTSDMDTLPTEYTIEFTDGERLYKKSSERIADLAATRDAIEPIAENITHLEITRRDQARRVVAEYMRQRRGGALQGTAQVRRSKGRSIQPGDYFRLDIDTMPGGAGLAQLMRCTGRSFGPTGPIALEFQSEPASAPVPFAHPWGDAVPDAVPALPPLYYQRSISLPPAAGEAPTLTVLAARPADDVTGLEVMYDDNLEAGTFPMLGHVRGFGLPVTLVQSLSASAGTVRVGTFDHWGDGGRADRERWLLEDGAGANDTEARDDTLLLVLLRKHPFFGSLLPHGDLSYIEVCAISSIALAAEDTWDLGVLRGRLGTAALAFDSSGGASFPDPYLHYEGWVIPRASLDWFQHGDFPGLMRAGTPGYFRFRSYSRWAIYDPATAYEAGLQANADWTTWSFTWPAGYDLPPIEGYTITLTKETHAVACAADGTPNAGQLGAGSPAQTTVSVWRGNIELTAVAADPGRDEFAIALGTCTGATATKVGNTTVRCDTLSADTGTIELQIAVAGAFTAARVFTLSKATAGTNGTNGDSVSYEYSANGINYWHSTFSAGDYYARQRIGAGGWSAAFRIVGENGAAGPYTDYIFVRSATPPATPTGNTPSGWYDAPPAGSDPLWMSKGNKASGVLIGSWSVPVRITGDKGTDGTDGDPGPGIVYRGPYAASTVYYHTATRRDVVASGGAYYLANNPAKSGGATWADPGVGDWASFGATFESVATKLLLAEDATILRTLVMGDVTAASGTIRSYGATAYEAGTGYWLGPDGRARFGSTTRYARWTGSTFEVKGDYFEVGATTAPFIVDLDPTYPAAARLRFGAAEMVTDGTASYTRFKINQIEINGQDNDFLSSGLAVWGGRENGRAGRIMFGNSYWIKGNMFGPCGAAAIVGLDTGAQGGRLQFCTTANGSGAQGHPIPRFAIDENGYFLDASGNRILRGRSSITPTTLQDVIDVLQYHGLCT